MRRGGGGVDDFRGGETDRQRDREEISMRRKRGREYEDDC